MATTLSPRKAEKERTQWLAVLEQLANQVEDWASKRKWPVNRESKQINETRLGTYAAPVLSILTPSGTIQLDPVARYVAKADGRVDLLAWPSLTRMLLIRINNRWKIKTDSGIDWPEGWTERTFARLPALLSTPA